MKALIVADLHYSLRQFDWLLRVAADYDLVIIAGDLLDIAGHSSTMSPAWRSVPCKNWTGGEQSTEEQGVGATICAEAPCRPGSPCRESAATTQPRPLMAFARCVYAANWSILAMEPAP